MKISALSLLFISVLVNTPAYAVNLPKNIVKIYNAPKGIKLSSAYQVLVNGRLVPVYMAKVAAADPERRFKAVDDLLHSDEYYDTAAFAYFDMQGKVTITVKINQPVKSAKILPASAMINPVIGQNDISFIISKPQNLTVEINGEVFKSLHVFANPIEKDVPSPNDPNVIFFGPGVHDVSGMVIGDNKTVYVAGGAVVRSVIGANEKYGIEPSGLKNYAPGFELRGHHITFRGHGIIDASACSIHARNFVMVHGTDITLDGIILLNSSGWTVPLRQSSNVKVNNIKILSYRANSDGIDICNSRNVTVSNCFIRTNDDLIVVKTEAGEGKASSIIIQHCVLWNQLANALSLGAELREDVNDVLFTDCDIIHDYSRAWCLRIFHSDASTISNIRFENIRIEEAHQLISLWIGKDVASYGDQHGHISNIIFKDVSVTGSPLNIDIVGASEQSVIDNVTFKNVLVNGKPLPRDWVKKNPFVRNITVTP